MAQWSSKLTQKQEIRVRMPPMFTCTCVYFSEVNLKIGIFKICKWNNRAFKTTFHIQTISVLAEYHASKNWTAEKGGDEKKLFSRNVTFS
jgi:hypothetical protein